MLTNWEKCLFCTPYLPSAILSKFIWFNASIKNDNKGIFISDFASKNNNFVGQMFCDNGKTKSWGYTESLNLKAS